MMAGFDALPGLVLKARNSSFWLWVLNRVLGRTIPFNRPHGFRLQEIGENRIVTSCRYRRVNHNHVRGIHACAIATVAEFSAGFLLLTKLEPTRYRLIMSRIEVDYVYQAKEDIYSESQVSTERLDKEVIQPLESSEAVTIVMQSRVRDTSGNAIATAHTTWQIKRWESVRTVI